MQSFLRNSACRTSRPICFRAAQPAFRPISSTQRLRLKEDKQQSKEEIESAKQEQLKTGNRKEELQSQSESVIGADRESVKDHDEHMDQLQKETAKQHEKEHPHGKS